MNGRGLTIIILIAIIAWVGWQYFLPSFNTTMELRQTVSDWQAKLANAKELSKKLIELEKRFNSMSSEADKISQVVTKKEDVSGLLVQLETLSSQNGLVLESVKFNTAVDAKKNKAAQAAEETSAIASSAAAGPKTMVVELSLSGSLTSFLGFLKAVENNLRIMDMLTINFDLSKTVATASQSFKASMNVYYRE